MSRGLLFRPRVRTWRSLRLFLFQFQFRFRFLSSFCFTRSPLHSPLFTWVYVLYLTFRMRVNKAITQLSTGSLPHSNRQPKSKTKSKLHSINADCLHRKKCKNNFGLIHFGSFVSCLTILYDTFFVHSKFN